MPAATIMMTTQMRKNREQKEQGNFSFGKPKQAPTPPPEKPKRECKNPVLRVMNDGLELLNLTSTQTVTYFGMTVTMLLLISAMRSPEEFFFDKHVMDRIVDNTFDSAHNKFTQVRRIADVFEWGNKVLLPGLFADAGPCGTGEAIGSLTSQKACLDEVWPDGDGTFHMTGATTLSIADLVERMDQFDWTDGLTVRQVRAQPVSCPDTDQLGACLPEVSDGHVISTATYGHNMGSKPFVYHAAEDIGASPTGIVSASIPSLRGYEGGGFFGFVIPFFSDVYLPSQEGTFDQMIDYRQSRVSTTNGKEAKFHCVRTSLNGVHIKQRCDPGANGDGTGELTSAVRNHVEEFWNDLKRGHWIDTRTRMVVMVLQLRSNHLGIRYRISLMFEFTSLGTVLPSYDVETRVLSRTAQRNMRTYAYICLGMVIFFIVLEGVELTNSSIGEYFADVWNLMDWSNFVVYFLVFMQLLAVDEAQLNPDCSSYMCRDAGYFDDYKVMSEYRTMKLYFSLCVCIQLLKILKFASALVPKMGLATDVLRECAIDLVFFGVTFIISMAAFAMMLYVQLGPVMEGYVTQTAAFISLFRALFGDFDIDEIMDNSSGYLNALLFLAYLVRKPDSNPRPFALLELEFLCPSSLQSAEGRTFESHSGSTLRCSYC